MDVTESLYMVGKTGDVEQTINMEKGTLEKIPSRAPEMTRIPTGCSQLVADHCAMEID